MNTERIREYQEIRQQEADLNATLSELEAERKAIEEEIQEDMLQCGTSLITVDGKRISMSIKKFCSGKKEIEKGKLAEWLIDQGLGHLATIHSSTLSTHIKEAEKNGDTLPEGWSDRFQIYEKITLSCTPKPVAQKKKKVDLGDDRF